LKEQLGFCHKENCNIFEGRSKAMENVEAGATELANSGASSIEMKRAGT